MEQSDSRNKYRITNHGNESKHFKITSVKPTESEDPHIEYFDGLVQKDTGFPTDHSTGRKIPEKALYLRLRCRKVIKTLLREALKAPQNRTPPA